MKTRLLITVLIATVVLPCRISAQNSRRGSFMPYVIEGKDTIYLSPLAEAHVYDKKKRKKGREWRKYYRLVYNFARVYPYALVGRSVVLQADSVIKADNLRYTKKDRYVDQICKDLFRNFEKPLKNLTVSQGQLLMKLMDRECGITSYCIIKDFKNRYAAAFWQGIAKLFGNDLKKPYDPKGEDAPIEELISQWKSGKFEQTYFEIFWEYPPEVVIPESYSE